MEETKRKQLVQLPISVIVLAHEVNENLKECLGSLAKASEVVLVITSNILDAVEIKKRDPQIKVVNLELKNDFAALRNHTLTLAENDWVFFVDSDEIISPELWQEIEEEFNMFSKQNLTLNPPKFQAISPEIWAGEPSSSKDSTRKGITGYSFNRQDWLWGKPLLYGETANWRGVRLAKKSNRLWRGSIHEVWEGKGAVKELKNPIKHLRPQKIEDWLTRLHWYAKLQAKQFYQSEIKESLVAPFAKPIGKALYNLFWLQGFRDGSRGLIMVFLMSWHSILVRVWLRLLWMNEGKESVEMMLDIKKK